MDKGCDGNIGPGIQLTGTAYTLDAWFYENGEGACSLLYYYSEKLLQQFTATWLGQTAVVTMVKDPALLVILQAAQAAFNDAVAAKTAAQGVVTQLGKQVSRSGSS